MCSAVFFQLVWLQDMYNRFSRSKLTRMLSSRYGQTAQSTVNFVILVDFLKFERERKGWKGVQERERGGTERERERERERESEREREREKERETDRERQRQ